MSAGSELRTRVAAEPGGLTIDRDEVVGALAPSDDQLNPDDSFEPLGPESVAEERARAAEGTLRRHGIVAEPPLLRSKGPIALHTSDRFALAGAIVPALVLALAAAAGYWIYGAAFAVAGAIAGWLVARQRGVVDRVVPSVVPRGYALGALVVAPLLLIAGLAVVLPVRAHRKHVGEVAGSQKILQAARDAVARHDFTAAYAYLDVAAARPLNQGVVANVRAQAVAAQVEAALDEQDRKAGIFDQGDLAERRGDLRGALKLFKSIAGFRDADERAKALERRLAARRR